MAKTVTNNSFDNKPARGDDDKTVARALGGAHPKSQPPTPSPFASGPSNAGGQFTQPPSALSDDEQTDEEV